MDISVKIKNLYKRYSMQTKASGKVLDMMLPNGYGEDFYAIQDLSFEAKQGDVIGLIGVNGSGKSTLSNIIAGIVPATYGEVEVNGETSLIAVSAGLKNELTGRENIELKCLMMGFTIKQIRAMEDEIIEFADLGKFIDQPVKKYSSGMRSRLGFAISVTIDPDILIIDEALSVGDRAFADKCYKKMNEFKDKGRIIFFVSHSLQQVRDFCNKAIWLEFGEIREMGDIEEVVNKYDAFLKEYKAMSNEEKKQYRADSLKKQENLSDELKQMEKREKHFGFIDGLFLLGAIGATAFAALQMLLAVR